MPTTLQSALRAATGALNAAGIDDAALDARILLAHAVGISRDRLTLHLPDEITAEAQAALDSYITRRMAYEPVAKIIGYRGFWGREFIVTADVLDPRPETETLIAEALKGPVPDRILDLGTGSGVLAITLLCEWSKSRAVATDISIPAQEVAFMNAKTHDVSERLELRHSDWFKNINEVFDLIVSNPPYITADELEELSPEVRLHDPHLALIDQGDGLMAYRQILTESPKHLRPQGRLMVEIGWQQGKSVSQLFQKAGFKNINIISDLEGRDRVISGMWTA